MTEIIIKGKETVCIKDLEVGDWFVDDNINIGLVTEMVYDAGHFYRAKYFSFAENKMCEASNSSYKVYKKKAVVELE